jgi:hypothetical protein
LSHTMAARRFARLRVSWTWSRQPQQRQAVTAAAVQQCCGSSRRVAERLSHTRELKPPSHTSH